MTFALFVVQIGQFIIAVEASSQERAELIARLYIPEPHQCHENR